MNNPKNKLKNKNENVTNAKADLIHVMNFM